MTFKLETRQEYECSKNVLNLFSINFLKYVESLRSAEERSKISIFTQLRLQHEQDKFSAHTTPKR